MMEWKNYKIQDLPISIIDGDRSERYPKRSEFVKQGVYFLNTGSIDSGRLNTQHVNYISEGKYSQIIKGRLKENDLVLTTRGSIGKVLFFKKEYDKALINAQMLIFRVNDDSKILSKYLYYYFSSSIFQLLIKNFSSGSAQPQLPISDLKHIHLSIPSLLTQKKIATILSTYDDLIENNQKRIAILEKMAQNLYQEWFVRFRFPDWEKVEFVEGLPKGWEMVEVDKIATEIRNNIKVSEIEEDIKYVGLEHIPRKSIILNNWEIVKSINSNKLGFTKNEILFCKIRPYFHKVVIAPFDGICSSDTIVIKSRKEEHLPFVLFTVSSVPFVDYSAKTAHGTKMPRTDWKILKKYEIPFPSNNEALIDQFNKIIVPMIEEMNIFLNKNENLKQTRDRLLPRLLSGKLEV